MVLRGRVVEVGVAQELEVVLVDLRETLRREPYSREPVAGEIDGVVQHGAIEEVGLVVNVHQCARDRTAGLENAREMG